MSEQQEKQTLEAVDITKLVGGPKIQLDLDEDAWAWNAPPPAGPYKVKIFGDQNGWSQPAVGKKLLPETHKDFYLVRGLECRISSDNSDYDNIPVFTKISTRLGKSKNISTCMGLLIKMGLKKGEQYKSLTHKEQASLFEAMLKREIMLDVDLDWQGGYSDEGKGPRGGDWVPVFRTYKDFPNDPENPGMKQHIVSVGKKSGSGTEEVRAMLRIVAWYGKGETRPEKKAPVNSGIVLDDEPQIVTPGPAIVQQVAQKVNSKAPEEISLDLLE